MISYLEGVIHHFNSDGIVLLAGQVGYDILLNSQMVEKLRSQHTGDEIVTLYIYYYQTERQPKPVLIGFESLENKQFFQVFITVDAIGPMKAIKAMTCTAGEIANAIETKNIAFLTQLNGIGKRTARKIIASLHGKMKKFIGVVDAEMTDERVKIDSERGLIIQQVADVLMEQLGHSHTSARRMIKEAFERKPDIYTPEALFDEIFKEG